MLVDDVINRLKERVGDLQNRVEGAAHLAQLQAQKQLPQHTPAANVVASGLQGGLADAGAGLYRQSTDETVSVVLTFRNVQGKGGDIVDLYVGVRNDVIAALCGWAPGDTTGVFRLVAGRMVSMGAGTLVYQIDFAIGDQLRIDPT